MIIEFLNENLNTNHYDFNGSSINKVNAFFNQRCKSTRIERCVDEMHETISSMNCSFTKLFAYNNTKIPFS